MKRVGKLQRLSARFLPVLLILTLLPVVSAQLAHAVTTPAVSVTPTSGVTAKTGAGDANSFASQIGRTITFTVTLTGLTPNQMPTGQIRVVDGEDTLRRILCITSTFSMTGDSATASCNWTPKIISGYRIAAQYLTNPNNGTDYLNAISSTSPGRIYIAGIVHVFGIDGSIPTSDTKTITVQTYMDFRGQISFFANGSPISGCQNVTVNGSDQASCPYFVQSDAKTIVFTFDYTPGASVATGLTLQKASFPVEITVGAYYYPDESNWYQRTGPAYDTNFSASALNAEFHQNANIFYKLNASTGEAIVVSYNRTAFTGTSLVIPETFTVTTRGGVFNRTYTVTQIGKNALSIVNGANGSPATLLTSVTIPNTVTLIGDGAFNNQCNIRTLILPDSVRVIGSAALNNMKRDNGLSVCDNGLLADDVTGLETLTVGSGLETLGDNAMKFLGDVKSITFKGSPASMVPVLNNPAGFDAFQWGTYGARQNMASSGGNGCGAVITYSNAITAYLMGSQANAWKFWARADNCITGEISIVNTQFVPSAPAQPVAETPTVSSMHVSWNAPANNGDSAITGYSIQYSSNNGSTWTQSSCTSCQVDSSPFTATNLSAATSYIFRVIATNEIGTSTPSISSLPVSTLSYTSAPAFTITPTAETITAGSAITYSISSSYPAASYAISPAAQNGLTFNTSTGVLSGTVQAIETAVAYAVTGTNTFSSRTETYTLTVIAAPAIPPAPTNFGPPQTSSITSVSERCMKPDNIIEIKGAFEAKVVNIAINGELMPLKQWSQSPDSISFIWGKNLNKNIEIQIYNGQFPLLQVQRLTFVDQCAVEQANVVEPTTEPTKDVNTQPTVEMKKISALYFALGSYLVGKSNKVQLAKIAAEIMNSSVKTVLIYGHTDSQGGIDNTVLSKNRAQAVVKQMRPLLKGKSIRIGWFAAKKPAVKGKTAAAYAKNRRVEIWVK